MKANLIVYTEMIEKSLLVLFFNSFAKNKELKSGKLHYICMKKRYLRTTLKNTCIDKRLLIY